MSSAGAGERIVQEPLWSGLSDGYLSELVEKPLGFWRGYVADRISL